MPGIDTNRNRMLALIATVLATAALRASYPGKTNTVAFWIRVHR